MDTLRNLFRAAAVVAGLGLLTGCVTDPAPKKTAADPAAKKAAGDDDSLTRQARQLRGSSPDDRGTGLLDKSRDIENDLGFH